MATQASEQLAVRVCDGTISAARKRTSSVHYRTVARAVERKDMAPHQTFYLKADRSLLNPHKSADRVTSIEKATVLRERERGPSGERPARGRVGSNQGQGRALLPGDEGCALKQVQTAVSLAATS
jgi:hypothetical protein